MFFFLHCCYDSCAEGCSYIPFFSLEDWVHSQKSVVYTASLGESFPRWSHSCGRWQLAVLRIFGGELGIIRINSKGVLLLWNHPR